jgi:ATP-dependent Clp protease ATP-binding subunit ClpC
MPAKQYLGWKPSFVKYTINLNQQAAEGTLDPVVGRDKERAQIIDALSRRTKNNPLIIGESGVGKTAIVEGLAQKIIKGDVPDSMKRKEILLLDYSALVAGARQKGEFEQRVKDLISDVIGAENTILFIEDIHLLLDGNSSDKVKPAEIFKKFLDHGQFPLIGITTSSEYRKIFDKDRAFERNFQVVQIEEPNDEDSFAMIQATRSKFEKYHSVIIPDEIVKQSIALTKKYVPQRFLPDKALDAIDEAAADVKVQIETGKRGNNIVKKADIEKVLSDWTGIKITRLTEDESKKLLMLEKLIHKKFVGQNNAVTKVAEAVRRGRIGLSSSKRPIASFVFHGGSGVGKSELVKVLGQILFEKEDSVLQLDMSEYMEKQDVAKLIGAPPGYVGYDEGGLLTEAVNSRPGTVILMDNIEKVHPDVANILLQILEEGSLTDNKGNKVSFKNTLIVCTTSLGQELIQQKIEILPKDVAEKDVDALLESLQPVVKEELLKFFAPEIVNRFDGIVSFKPLSPKNMEDISRLFISRTAALLKKQNFSLQVTNQAVSQLAAYGYSPKEGARPLRRIVTDLIENSVTKAIIAQKFNPGDTILVELTPEKSFAISTRVAKILANSNINLPKLKDIAEYDRGLTKNEQTSNQEVDNIYLLLKKLAGVEAVTDSGEKTKLEELQKQLADEKAKGNPTADVILLAVQSLKAEKPATVPLPSVNGIQVVTEDEFDEVKAIWQENYLDMESTGNSVETQIDWVKKESEDIQDMIKLLTSKEPKDKDSALHELVHILPVFLVGGFTEEEVIAYLRAKEAGATAALESLTEEEAITLSVHKINQKPQEKTMRA